MCLYDAHYTTKSVSIHLVKQFKYRHVPVSTIYQHQLWKGSREVMESSAGRSKGSRSSALPLPKYQCNIYGTASNMFFTSITHVGSLPYKDDR